MIVAAFVLASVLAADDITERLAPWSAPELNVHAAVYDVYPNGRPRRVVAVIGNIGDGKLYLFRFPDSARGKPAVLDEEDLDAGPVGVELRHIVHPKDVVVTMVVRHGERAIVEHVVDDRFEQIADDFTEAVDLDGDGVPEIITTAYVGQNDCGVDIGAWLAHWNGRTFIGDRRHYVTVLGINGSNDQELHLDGGKRYAVRRFGRGRVTLDGERIAPGKPFRTEDGCHTIALRGAAPKTRVFLEELP